MKHLIEKFFAKQLTPKEAAILLEMLQNDTIAEELYTTAMIKEIFAKNEENTFRGILKEIEYEEKHRLDFSNEEIDSFFAPIEEYEDNLEGISRASTIHLLQPQNHINCTDSLLFELKKPFPNSIVLLIENNDFDELYQTEIPPNLSIFEINLSSSNGFKPGRFYWKIISTQQQLMAMGVFFIGKGLMLSNPQ